VFAVTVAEDEVRRPGGEQFHDGHRADVAAVQHGFDAETFKHPHRGARVFDVAVGIANDAESHDGYLNASPAFGRQLQILPEDGSDAVRRSGQLTLVLR
jgi:hypothetical protein